jgi:hypothetical protein
MAALDRLAEGCYYVAASALDPNFPIECQLAFEAALVVLANVFTFDKSDEQTFVKGLADHPSDP